MFSLQPLAIVVGIAVSMIPSSATGQNCASLADSYAALSCRIGIAEPVVTSTEPVDSPEKVPLPEKRALTIPDVRVTTYHATVRENDSDPSHGASGVLVKPGMVAVSRDLLWRNGGPFRWGDTLTLAAPGQRSECNRSYIVEDTMSARFTERVDILLPMSVTEFSCYHATITYTADEKG